MKKLLITGAYGLVGSNICEVLERDYPDIEVTKVKFDEHVKKLYVEESVIEKSFDYVIYAAGYGQPLLFMEDKLETIKIHCGTPLKTAFSLLKEKGTFLYVSTSEIYSGSLSPHKETDIGTTTPQHPRACYIEGKRCGEAICMAYKEQDYNVKIARLALAYGPGTKKGDTRVLNQFIEQALTKGEIQLMDDGSAIRTYMYVKDTADIMLKILFEGNDCVYNVGGISRTTIYDLAKEIGDILKVPVNIGSKKLVGAPDHVELDISKIRNEFKPKFTFLHEGLKETINYQKQLYV